MKIVEDLIPAGKKNRPKCILLPEYITIHDTGNESVGADAKCHSKYLKNTDNSVSWHYTVDDSVIYQHLPISENGWHCGDGEGGKGNRKSIGIEICMNKDGNRKKAENKTAKLVVYLMKKYNIPINNVVQHNYWSGKDCPKLLRSSPNGWTDFLRSITDIKNNNKEEDVEVQVPKWQVEAFNNLKDNNFINSPQYWESRLKEKATVGEILALVNKVLEQRK